MNVKRAFLLIGTALASNVGVARAQSAASDQPQTEIYVATEVRHDSNVARTDPTLAASRGLVNGDERLTPSIGVLINRPLGRNALMLNGSIGYDFYRRNHRLNRERLNFGADVALRPGFCEVDLAPTFSRQQSDLAQIAYLNATGIDSVRNTETVQNYHAGLTCGRRPGLQPYVEYDRGIGNNSNTVRKISDYRTNRYGGGIKFTNPAVGDLSLGYARTDASYPHRIGTPLAAQSGYHTDEVTFSFKRDIGSVLTADGGIAYVNVSTEGSGVQSFTGLSYHLGAQFEPVPRLQMHVGLESSVKPALGAAALFERAHSYSADLDYAASSRTTFSLGASRSTHNYNGATNFYGPVLTDDHLTEVHGGVGFKFGQRLQLNLVGGHEVRRANGTIYDYSNTYVALRTRFTI